MPVKKCYAGLEGYRAPLNLAGKESAELTEVFGAARPRLPDFPERKPAPYHTRSLI